MSDVYGEDEHPLPFDEHYRAKPAYTALLSGLNEHSLRHLKPGGANGKSVAKDECHYTKGCL